MSKSHFIGGHALIVAIADYLHVNGLPQQVINDATDMYKVLTSDDHCAYAPSNVRLLLDKHATLANIRSELARVATSARPDDSVFIYFSGHGAQLTEEPETRSALVPVDAEIGSLPVTTLLEAELSRALHTIAARRLVVVIDACHAGGAGSLKSTGSALLPLLGFSEKSLSRLSTGHGRVIFASCRASETSLIMPGARNSLFSTHFIDALSGKLPPTTDGMIRVFDVFNYVSVKVKNAASGLQHPIFKASDLEENFPVALYRGGTKSAPIPQTVLDLQGQDVWAVLAEVLPELYPSGPNDQEIWTRAGGDSSRLQRSQTGRSEWHAALRLLKLGGGGAAIDLDSLVRAALSDYPHHHILAGLRGA